MALTTTDVMTRVMNNLRLPNTVGSEQYNRVLAILNEVYREILGKYVWRFLLKRLVFNTTPRYDAGTLTLTYNSTYATLSGPAVSSLLNRKVIIGGQASDSGAVYRIASHSANTSEIQFDAAYTGASLASTSYEIYQDEYNLATDCARVMFMTRFGFTNLFNIIGNQEMMRVKQFDTTVGEPMAATLMDFATSGDPTTQRVVMLHPYPDLAYRLEARYKQGGNAELSGTAKPLLPDEWIQVLIYGASARAYVIVQDDLQKATFFTQLFNDNLNLMVAQQREWEGYGGIVPKDQHRGFYTTSNRETAATGDLGTLFDRWPSS
jgi:hypothetical protein